MTTLTINLPDRFKKIPKKELERDILNILSEYNTFDLHLLDKYIKTKDLHDNHFVNL